MFKPLTPHSALDFSSIMCWAWDQVPGRAQPILACWVLSLAGGHLHHLPCPRRLLSHLRPLAQGQRPRLGRECMGVVKAVGWIAPGTRLSSSSRGVFPPDKTRPLEEAVGRLGALPGDWVSG